MHATDLYDTLAEHYKPVKKQWLPVKASGLKPNAKPRD
jgi:hypothetical protein